MKKIYLTLMLLLAFISACAQNWIEVNSPTTDDINSCTFINADIGWIVTGNAIYKTIDGGTTWTSQTPPLTPEYMVRRFNSIHFLNENIGIIGCTNFITDYANYDPAQVSSIAWTSDGGTTWEYKNIGNSNSHNADAIIVTPLIAYTIGQYGKSSKTVDGGETWTSCTFSSAGYSGTELVAIDENHVYFAGLQNFDITGAFGTMSNLHWTVSDISSSSMRSMFFIDINKGWAGSSNGQIMMTINGGNSWSLCTSNSTEAVYGISFKDEINGWAVTGDGKILRSINGGIEWTPEYNGTILLTDITFSGLGGKGYAVGNEGTILKYDANLSTNLPEKEAILIFPNPANDLITIGLGTEIENINIIVYNSIGQPVIEKYKVSSNKVLLETDRLNNGIYYISFQKKAETIYTSKVVIAH